MMHEVVGLSDDAAISDARCFENLRLKLDAVI